MKFYIKKENLPLVSKNSFWIFQIRYDIRLGYISNKFRIRMESVL